MRSQKLIGLLIVSDSEHRKPKSHEETEEVKKSETEIRETIQVLPRNCAGRLW